jgi:Abnormal spindle-like microcephaly-assoc'd, ASPM-SPD-2-Hydin
MGHLPNRWNVLVVVLALATMVGCQGLSTSKANLQGSQENELIGTLTAAPASVAFGNVQAGTSQTLSDTLSNTGTANLTITQAAVTGTGFSTTGLNLPLTLAPGQSTTFSVIFTPQSIGSASGTLALTNSGSNSTLSIALSGTAVAAGNLSASPTSFSFGSIQTGTSQTQTETLNNTGGESLTISQAAASGAGFSFTGLSLPMTLAANQSTTFGVVFAPTAAGASSGKLSITISGSATTLDIGLSGTGVTPAALTATPASLTFANVTVNQSQAQTETVKNVGGQNATISQATVAGTGFSISGISAPLTLTPGQSASFTVTFAPGSAGSFPGSVVINSNASNPTLSIGLTGSAVAQAVGTLAVSSVNVGSVVVGTSGTQTGTLSASGASVSVSSVSLSGADPSEFSISGLTFPVTVTTTQPVTFTVRFAPTATGSASASASFASNASNAPTAGSLSGTGTAAQSAGTLAVSSVNVGSIVVGTSGTQTGTLTASGASVSVSSVSLGGTNPSEFSISGLTFPVTVTTAQPVTFTVTFTPGATGTATASASFASNASNTPTAGSVTGTGTAAPVHTVSLKWTASITTGITSYNVYRAVFGGSACGSYTNIGSSPSSTTAYTDNVVADGTTYCYATTAVDPSGESAYSNITQAMIPAP